MGTKEALSSPFLRIQPRPPIQTITDHRSS
jgi:hypothetical protein